MQILVNVNINILDKTSIYYILNIIKIITSTLLSGVNSVRFLFLNLLFFKE